MTAKCTCCCIELSEDLKTHYHSDLHRYNLKRQIGGLPSVTQEQLDRKIELLSSAGFKVKGTSHLKHPTQPTPSVNHSEVDSQSNPTPSSADGQNDSARINRWKGAATTPTTQAKKRSDGDEMMRGGNERSEERAGGESGGRGEGGEADERPPLVVDPTVSLFDGHKSESLQANFNYMRDKHSFFVPDLKYLVDPMGLVKYLSEKVYDCFQCVYCNRQFRSIEGVRAHMIDKGHTMLGTDDYMEEEYEEFYDFTESIRELNLQLKKKKAAAQRKQIKQAHVNGNQDKVIAGDEGGQTEQGGDEGDGWEDETEDVGHLPTGKLLRNLGLKPLRVTELGSLRLPDGRQAGPREFHYIYRQHLRGPQTQLVVRHTPADLRRLKMTRKQLAENSISPAVPLGHQLATLEGVVNHRHIPADLRVLRPTQVKSALSLAERARRHGERRRQYQRMKLGVDYNNLERVMVRVLL
eukprot:GHVN01063890.1.p1 GENE.GHVN01063890.1~~GHVN01063890.1.p1  ORF type:complete len:466 (+),score=101.73 GHVN01063890.1:52-1449(+)